MGKGKIEEKVIGVTKFLYPYYDVDMEAKIRVIEKTGWFSKEEIVKNVNSRTSVDGNTGAIVDVTSNGISYVYSYLTNLTAEEIYLLYYVSGVKAFEKRNLSAIGWSDGKINKTVNSLTGKGLLVQTSTRPAIYKPVNQYPYNPSVFTSLIEKFKVTDTISNDKKMENNFPAGSIATFFNAYWSGCDIKSIDLVYYPYYAIIYERKDETKRTEIIDGITGQRQEYLERIMTASAVQ
ncbi:MAG: hypothetical protein ACREAG_03680 [Nitrosopumilaceae archaeon]